MYYECPYYIVALLREINRQLDRVMWNNTQQKYDSPFENTGNHFKNDTFEVYAYDWNDDNEQEYNFLYKVDKSKANCKDIKITWYKYLGRDTRINQQLDCGIMIDMFNDCINSLLDMDKGCDF